MSLGLIAGIAYLYVDGMSYPLVGDFSYRVASVSRETKAGMDSVHGYGEKPIPSFLQGNVRDWGQLSLQAVNAMTGVTVVAKLANGKTITLGGAWTVGEGEEVKSDEGDFQVRWESDNVTEAMA